MIATEENIPERVVEFLEEEYRTLSPVISALLDRARGVPQTIDDDAVMGDAAKIIKELRDEAAKAEAFRVKEKEPYLRGEQAVDNFFFPLIEKCKRRDRKQRPGAADILQSRVDDYQQRKLAEEQRKRDEAARIAREEAERRQREEDAARKKAEEERAAAERARKPENIAAKTAIADASAETAAHAKTEATLATQRAEEAHVDTLARPADMVRTRVEQGPTVTMARENYAVIEDETKLDMAKLWPFISLDAKEKALRAWAKTTGYTQQMPGATIGTRPKSVVR